MACGAEQRLRPSPVLGARWGRGRICLGTVWETGQAWCVVGALPTVPGGFPSEGLGRC